jgi:hypothetical protein
MATIMSAIYGGGPFYAGSPALSTLNQTGFTTVVCWAVHVHTNGDLIYNDTQICSEGAYTGDASWGDELKAVKTGGSVNRILFSIGGWDTGDFTNLQQIIDTEGTGPNTVLYQNFAALLKAIPVIDGIDLDDEDNYDQNTIVQLCQMLATIGYGQITFCPYTQQAFWNNCLSALNQSNPGLVTGYNLQCYAGGSNNLHDVSSWISGVQAVMGTSFDAAAFVNPGLWCLNGADCSSGMSPGTIEAFFKGWATKGIAGGFIWLYDDIMKCGNDPQDYAVAINDGLGG